MRYFAQRASAAQVARDENVEKIKEVEGEDFDVESLLEQVLSFDLKVLEWLLNAFSTECVGHRMGPFWCDVFLTFFFYCSSLSIRYSLKGI